MLRRSGPVRWMGIWLAIASVLLLNVMPTLSGWVGGVRSAQWVELCRGASVVWVNVADTSGQTDRAPPAPNALDHLFKHCPYCALHIDVDVPAMPSMRLPLLSAWRPLVPTAFLQAPSTPYAWRAAQPRAPPDQV